MWDVNLTLTSWLSEERTWDIFTLKEEGVSVRLVVKNVLSRLRHPGEVHF